MLKDYVSIQEAASALRLSASTVRRLFDERRLQGFRTPKGHRRVLRADVEKQVENMNNDGITFPPKEP